MYHNVSDLPKTWLDKRFYSLDAYCKSVYQEKLYKIAIDAGCTCPNRDGTLDTRGCIFCSTGGSGDFAVSGKKHSTIEEQIKAGKALFHDKKIGNSFIAYFQSYTNTYGDLTYLRRIFEEALAYPDIRGISIATRPDCLAQDVMDMLISLKNRYPDKFIWVELGLQSMHAKTADFIRRGYDLSVYERAVTSLVNSGFPVITHVILGLPGESKEDFLKTIQYLNQFWSSRAASSEQQGQELPLFGIKLQLLHVLKGTDLADCFARNEFDVLTKEDYLDWLIAGLEQLAPHVVVHRLTGDGPRNLLIAPLWSLNKRGVLNAITQALKKKGTWQGKEYHGSTYNSSL